MAKKAVKNLIAVPAWPILIEVSFVKRACCKWCVSSESDKLLIVMPSNNFCKMSSLLDSLLDPDIKIFSYLDPKVNLIDCSFYRDYLMV